MDKLIEPMSDKSSESTPSHAAWETEYRESIPAERPLENVSGIPVKPLYTPQDWARYGSDDPLSYPGQPDYTRGIYATMYRGRTWTQRQLVGLGTPADYNARLLGLMEGGATAVSLIPCNSVYRGYDMSTVDKELLGTCGVVINNVDHMQRSLQGVDVGEVSCALNDPSPFTLLAFMLIAAERRGTDWRSITGTSNQSDYISHFVANHMFYRLSLSGSRRVLLDHIAYCKQYVPRWNPMSVVGQHMQQAGATPAEAMAFTLCTAIQNAEDCIARGMDPDDFLPRFTFFFDISLNLFEEVAKFRAGRRIWSQITRERLGAKDPRSCRFKFHGQTSGVDLTRQQPLNNIARVTVQAMAGIFGGLQSLHTDAYDEALACPSEFGARIAVATQNILREESHLTDVIDPLGGSFYVEALTDQMEDKIRSIIKMIDEAGGMYKAVESGQVQRMIGASALRAQRRIESGEQIVVGVNAFKVDENASARPLIERPDPVIMQRHLDDFAVWKNGRSATDVDKALDHISRVVDDSSGNVFGAVVDGARAGLTHEEICARLRRDLGFGHPLAVV
ncbi:MULTISPECIES: methylmalonyl-CoA mutase [unclassified Polaromonas]|uniref:acyl-CoA mutase large subunit family protein n=1 Tax=unclassified Polaromonas TaxID=2638319 RepID=UPI002489A5B8|nr:MULTISPECIES: acyl-CoA mutase large subunit family protein [unclassified Polaromonas]MDI1274841.1 acyl-CoA mutase large subunit family protein [Polaromonas sp.]